MKLTPKEKAKELVDKFYPLADGMGSMEKFYDEVCFENQKQCALIAVDEIISIKLLWFQKDTEHLDFWKEVKQELLKIK